MSAEGPRTDALRRRMVWVLFAVSALGSTGYLAALTAGTLVAADLGGSAAVGGLPTTATTLGTAGAAALMSVLMLRAGRRPGLLVGIAGGAIGGGVALGAVLVGSIPLLLLGCAATIGTVVWGATIGAVAGPNTIAPAGAMAEWLGLPALAGTYLLSIVFIGAAMLIAYVFLRPEPYSLAHPSATAAHADGSVPSPTVMLLRRPSVLVALVSLVASQVVMVLVMTMTPLHLIDHGHGLETVGFVLSAHTLGMFALSPISGRLTDRFGSPRVIAAGLATLASASVLAALAPADGGLLLTLALFMLGFGWSLGFVAGSSMLTEGLVLGERTRVQGVADALIWTSAAAASLASGIVVALASYAILGILAVGLLVPPAFLLARRTTSVVARPT